MPRTQSYVKPPFDPSGRKAAEMLGLPEPPKPTLSKKVSYTYRYLRALQERPPLVTVRQVLWVLLGGWLLFLAYAAASIALLLSLVFIPFGLQGLRLSV